jgi:acyl carrier protein
MSNNSSLLEILQDMLHDRLAIEKSKVTLDAPLADLGIDSLMQIELMFDFEDKYKVKIPDITERPTTIGELLAVIEPYIKKS